MEALDRPLVVARILRTIETEFPAPDVYMQNCRVYEKSDLRTCRIGVIPRVRKTLFSYMQNWGTSACGCGMFFVQGGPEPALYILETEFPAPDVYMQNYRMYEKSVLRTCRIGVRVHVDVVCFSC